MAVSFLKGIYRSIFDVDYLDKHGQFQDMEKRKADEQVKWELTRKKENRRKTKKRK